VNVGNNSGTQMSNAKRRYKALADMAASHGVVNGRPKKKKQADWRARQVIDQTKRAT
jgi:hypothetical protein